MLLLHMNILLLLVKYVNNIVNNSNKGRVSLFELNVFLTARCFYAEHSVQVRKVAVNIRNKYKVNCSLLDGRGANS